MSRHFRNESNRNVVKVVRLANVRKVDSERNKVVSNVLCMNEKKIMIALKPALCDSMILNKREMGN